MTTREHGGTGGGAERREMNDDLAEDAIREIEAKRATEGIIAPPGERELEVARQEFVNELFEGKSSDQLALGLTRDGLERLLTSYDSHLADKGLIKGLGPDIEH